MYAAECCRERVWAAPRKCEFVKDFALPEPQNLKISPALRAGFVLQVAILKGQRQILDTNRQYFGRRAKRGGFLKKQLENCQELCTYGILQTYRLYN